MFPKQQENKRVVTQVTSVAAVESFLSVSEVSHVFMYWKRVKIAGYVLTVLHLASRDDDTVISSCVAFFHGCLFSAVELEVCKTSQKGSLLVPLLS